MKLVALAGGIGRIEADGSVTRLDVPYPSLTAYVCAGESLTDLVDARVAARTPFSEAPLAPAAGPGSSVWGVGLNYRSKMQATGRPVPEHPVLFLKAPGSIRSARWPIVLPRASECVDYEGEIAVLVGAPLFEASPAEAGKAVIGFTAANDVTARDVMRWSGNPSLAKSFPGFGQLGSVVAVADGDLNEPIAIEVNVNGEPRQADRSDGMLVPIDELVAWISRFTPLWPGDVVLTGTPAGTGDETQRYLTPDDVVVVTVDDLPPMRSEVTSSRREIVA